MIQFEPLWSLALQELLLSMLGVVAIALMLVVLVEITCLFCALFANQLDKSGQRSTHRA
jgi:hypothetical protein